MPEKSNYESIHEKALKKIKNAAKDSDNEILEELSTELDPKERKDRESNCEAVHMVVDKCLKEYREGEYDFDETIEMIREALDDLD